MKLICKCFFIYDVYFLDNFTNTKMAASVAMFFNWCLKKHKVEQKGIPASLVPLLV